MNSGKRGCTHPLEGLLDRHLLRIDKAPHGDLDGQVDVVGPDILAEVHLCRCLGHADHALEMSHRDGERARGERLPAQVGVQPRQLVLVELVKLWADVLLGVHDVLSEHVLGDDLRHQHGSTPSRLVVVTHVRIHARRHVHLVLCRVKLRVTSEMTSHDELREHLVLHRVDRVLDDAEHVETGQDRLGELDVLLKRNGRVVSTPDRVSRGDDSAPGLEGRDDTGL